MPTYEYKCRHCGHTFEAFQHMKDEPLEKCPKCGKAVRRLIGGGIAIIFKGSGFYTNDYKSSSALMGANGSGKAKEAKAEKQPKTETAGDKKD